MNQAKHLNNSDKNVILEPANVSRLERISVCFSADFPIEFTIQRLEDVPLTMEPKESSSSTRPPQ